MLGTLDADIDVRVVVQDVDLVVFVGVIEATALREVNITDPDDELALCQAGLDRLDLLIIELESDFRRPLPTGTTAEEVPN